MMKPSELKLVWAEKFQPNMKSGQAWFGATPAPLQNN